MLSTALEGIRILDLTRVLAGPYCSMILGDLGAEIIKVEAPGGSDETRTWGPPFKGNVSAYYLCANRNKKSLTVNLKTNEGKEIIEKLVQKSDVILNNFKTGTMERLGLGYDHLKELNPDLIYCSITGFGESGPYRHLPGYDFIIQAMSGLMSITGDEQSGPQKLGVAITDILTGLYACIGIQAALLERSLSGEGQKIDLSLYDSAVSALVNIGSNFLVTGNTPARLGNSHANIVPYQTFQSKDGEMVIAVGNDRQFTHLCHILGQPSLARDGRFSTNAQRVENRDELTKILQKLFLTKETAYWKEQCRQKQIPFGPIQSLEEVRKDPQLHARRMFISCPHPKEGQVEMIGSPLNLSRTPVALQHHPPEAGEHTEGILRDLGYDEKTIHQWRLQKKI
ncbi:Succinyl-CoA:(R)-benzylsuccinate CoA-transferase subunit BbsF [Halobacillus karajensis]|uniref:Succinyl-CoA:(R)-benzylsuccinate CoA-transferase subunit BbsF n=1 Tax=Halobacillus karajensis TaxID=195088 RepID=A0A024P5A9_9BACI|nr:Succinyl-CoA:(R)-benzylsuccinate CoA-transferase subunit BbsF [Halobacillus karajensis]CDQ24199.1 Succinyl-CoA:(R)-benzylsuccinate CoA-transferase subunit BbsF [Halobacillus karajensis]CDQ29552.1 Succinyl-CoA:(R)-benzylsuccinate CoA-transferase subunit BbsF [Halobacillus karajensis]